MTDDSTFTRASVDSVTTDLLLAVLITGLVLLLFLHYAPQHDHRLAGGADVADLDVAGHVRVGLQPRLLTLLALALTIGILVDDSIMVLENIFRHLGLGESPKEAALNGTARSAWRRMPSP